MTDFHAAIERIKAEADWRTNPYFAHLADGSFDREDFVETQTQFFFAVVFFSRPMGVLAARLPTGSLRVNLLDNVREEHGQGDLHDSHEATFLRLLAKLGVSPDDLDSRALWPEVRSFNTLLSGLCTLDDVATGVAAMGMIEDLFAGISGFLGEQIAERGWLPADEIVHYTIHEKLDEEHAAEFYGLVAPLWDRHPRYRYQIEQGLQLGAYMFMAMYRGLWEARQRRALRDVRGAHSLASSGLLNVLD